jgi:hypothetical protein
MRKLSNCLLVQSHGFSFFIITTHTVFLFAWSAKGFANFLHASAIVFRRWGKRVHKPNVRHRPTTEHLKVLMFCENWVKWTPHNYLDIGNARCNILNYFTIVQIKGGKTYSNHTQIPFQNRTLRNSLWYWIKCRHPKLNIHRGRDLRFVEHKDWPTTPCQTFYNL